MKGECSTVQYSAVQYSTAQHSTVQYSDTAAAARLTCASGGGNPWPRLSFLINGSRVEAETLVPLVTSINNYYHKFNS